MKRGSTGPATELMGDFHELLFHLRQHLEPELQRSNATDSRTTQLEESAEALAYSVIALSCSEELTPSRLHALLPEELLLHQADLASAFDCREVQALVNILVLHDRTRHPPDRTGDAFLELWGLHETLLAHDSRATTPRMTLQKVRGSYYTPYPLVDSIIQLTIGAWTAEHPNPARCPNVLDPTCGNGNFLVRAARYLSLSTTTLYQPSILEHLFGFDIDPLAVYISRLRLSLLMPKAATPEILTSTIIVTNALRRLGEEHDNQRYDCVIGNPPFLNMLRGEADVLAARRASVSEATTEKLRKLLGPYSDLSAIFLQLSFSALRPGGYLGLCQPISLLSARDSEKIRSDLNSRGRLVEILIDTDRSFRAAVHVCVPILQRYLRNRADDDLEPSSPSYPWSSALVAALQLPKVPRDLQVRGCATVADVAVVAADFRDQYYWITQNVIDLDDEFDTRTHAAVITTRLIGSGFHRWGTQKARIGGIDYDRPAIVRRGSTETDRYSEWLRSRLRPKLILATQSQTLEVACDIEGSLVPLVPTLSVFPRLLDDLYHLLALLISPVFTTIALNRHLGSGLSPRALKLSASNLRELPLPLYQDPWDQAARLHHRALSGQRGLDAAERRSILFESALLMDQAFGITSEEGCHQWWLERLDL
ncbi:MAG: HsdM family class I SAM-dependent methyltransferase [Acidimicrobiales bacterium]